MRRQELYTAAKRAVERRRQQAETQALRRREEIYAALPALYELDGQKTAAGALAVRLAADGQAEAAAGQLALVRDVARRRALLLQQSGYTGADFAPRYACPECQDTGSRGGALCECVHEEVRRLRREEVNAAGPLMLCRFENFSLDMYPEAMEGVAVSPRTVMQGILQGCRDYADDFGPCSGSLLMFGDAGLGKTHLALSIAAAVLERGFDVIYVSAQSAFAAVSSSRYSGGSDVFASMLEADLLVLDDLGTEYIDAYVLSRLYELVNSRMRKPTIYTSNISQAALLNQRYTEKIASRLLGCCHLMRFWGRDIRLLQRGG